MLRLTLAALHLFALAFGPASVYVRGRALSERPLTIAAVGRAFVADAWWGAAAGLWIVTGVWRLLAGTEKATGYYLSNRFFTAKMSILFVILVLEVRPMITLRRWRRALKKSAETWSPDERSAAWITKTSNIQVVLVLMMLIAAVSMARGFGIGADEIR
jgi:putative membrane protein